MSDTNRPNWPGARFDDDAAKAFAATVATMLPAGVTVHGATFDAGNKMGVAITLPSGRRTAIRVNEDITPETAALILNDWLNEYLDMAEAEADLIALRARHS